MAEVLTDASVTFGGTDISDAVISLELSRTRAEIEATTMGSGSVKRTKGLKDVSLTLELEQDWADGSIDELIRTAYESDEPTAVVVKAKSGPVSVDNPSYSFNVVVLEHTPVSGAVGDRATMSITLPGTGEVTVATS